jgi:hypothetical protein
VELTVHPHRNGCRQRALGRAQHVEHDEQR